MYKTIEKCRGKLPNKWTSKKTEYKYIEKEMFNLPNKECKLKRNPIFHISSQHNRFLYFFNVIQYSFSVGFVLHSIMFSRFPFYSIYRYFTLIYLFILEERCTLLKILQDLKRKNSQHIPHYSTIFTGIILFYD